MSNDRISIQTAYGRSLVLFAFSLGVLAIAGWYLRSALLMIYISAIFAVVLKPAVDFIHGRSFFGWRPSPGAALMLLIVAVLLVAGIVGALAIPPIAGDIGSFASGLPQRLNDIRARLQSIPALRDFDLSKLQSYIMTVLGGVQVVAAGMASGFMSLLTALLLVAYLILDGDALLQGLLSTVPLSQRLRLEKTLARAGRRMRGWLVGQAMLMLILAVASGVVFGAMGIPYFLALAVFAGVANIIPMLGPLLTVLVAGLVALTDAPWKAAGVGIFYLVYQQVENAFLTPAIMQMQVKMSSAVVVIALLIGGELAGVLGALVAVPTAVLVIEIASEYLVQKREGEITE